MNMVASTSLQDQLCLARWTLHAGQTCCMLSVRMDDARGRLLLPCGAWDSKYVAAAGELCRKVVSSLKGICLQEL